MKQKSEIVTSFGIIFSITVCFHSSLAFCSNISVKIIDRPDTNSTNAFYIGNRQPLLPSPFIKLPVASIKPEGWLRKQIELQAAGFHGNLEEISTFLNKENNTWLDPNGQGRNGWEEVPYWLKGFGDTGYVLQK